MNRKLYCLLVSILVLFLVILACGRGARLEKPTASLPPKRSQVPPTASPPVRPLPYPPANVTENPPEQPQDTEEARP
jgi:hypothetical protein